MPGHCEAGSKRASVIQMNINDPREDNGKIARTFAVAFVAFILFAFSA